MGLDWSCAEISHSPDQNEPSPGNPQATAAPYRLLQEKAPFMVSEGCALWDLEKQCGAGAEFQLQLLSFRQSNSSQPETILYPRGHLTMSTHFDCPSWGTPNG